MGNKRKHGLKNASGPNQFSDVSKKHPEVTAEEIEKKIKELRNLQEQIDPSSKVKRKSRWPSFQTTYLIMEIIMCIAVIALSLYIYQTNQKKQAVLEAAIKETKANIDNQMKKTLHFESQSEAGNENNGDTDKLENDDWKEFVFD